MTTYAQLKKRGRYYHCRTTTDGKRAWRSTRSEYLADARVVVREWQRTDRAPAPRLETKTVLDGYLGSAARAENTRRALEYAASRWREAFGHLPIEGVTATVLEEYLRTREVAPSTRNLELRQLRAFFSWAVSRGDTTRNPAAGVSMARVVGRRLRVISRADGARVIEALSGECRHLVGVLFSSGLRVSTALKLERSHIHVVGSEWWLRLPPALMKSGRAYEAPLSPSARAHIQGQLLYSAPQTPACGGQPLSAPGDLLFSLSYRSALRQFSAACVSVGLDSTTRLHDLRGSFINHLASLGVPIEVTMSLTDHRSLRTILEHYRHVSARERVAATNAIQAPDAHPDGQLPEEVPKLSPGVRVPLPTNY